MAQWTNANAKMVHKISFSQLPSYLEKVKSSRKQNNKLTSLPSTMLKNFKKNSSYKLFTSQIHHKEFLDRQVKQLSFALKARAQSRYMGFFLVHEKLLNHLVLP